MSEAVISVFSKTKKSFYEMLQPSASRFLLRVLLASCILACAAFWPSSSGCLFYWLTGMPCPACGGTRALLALAHGDFFQSISWNPGLWLGMLAYLLVRLFKSGVGAKRNALFAGYWIWGSLGAVRALGVLIHGYYGHFTFHPVIKLMTHA